MALAFIFANNAGSTLAGPINNTTTALNVSSGGGAIFPNPVVGTQQFAITLIDAATGLNREICYVTAVTVDTFTILRGQEGTAAQNWLAGDLVQELWTAGQCAAMVQTNQVFAVTNTYYVNGTTGNDSNPGTNALPFKTIQACINVVSALISESKITINVAAGTYTSFSLGPSQIAGWIFVGSGPSTCNITNTTPGFRAFVASNTSVQISGFTFSAYFECLAVTSGGSVNVYNCNFVGIGSTSVAFASYSGAFLQLGQPGAVGNTTHTSYTISGSFNGVFYAQQSGTLQIGYSDGVSAEDVTITFGTTTVANGTGVALTGGSIDIVPGTTTFAGATPTGKKFLVTTAGGIVGAASLPGSIAGTTTTPGWTA